jgi:membrane fusion protein, macrolide-specific efflux system
MKKKRLFHKIPSKLGGLSLVILFLTILSACSLLPKEEAVLAPPLVEPAKVEYDVVEVVKGEIIKRVKGTGNLIPQNNQSLSYTQDGGRLKKIHVVEGDTVKEGQTLVEIETGNLLFDIEQLQYDLKKAELRLAQLKEQSADKYSIQIGELDVKSLELRLYQLNQQQAKSKIVSPIDGIVTYVTEIKQGEVIGAYESVIQVADTNDLQVLYTAMSGSDLADVKIGMEASATIGKNQVKGEVVQTPGDVPFDVYEQNPDLYGKSLMANLEKVPKDAKVGGIVDIEIITAKKSDTLIIPKNALRTAMGRNYVQVLLDNTKRELDIEVGIVSSTEVEVLKGLKEGDIIIVK